MKVGDQIRFYRKQRGWTQGELAANCGYFNDDGKPAQTRISNYENKHRTNFDEVELRNIAHVLGVSVGDLFNESTNDNTIINEDAAMLAFQALKYADKEFFKASPNIQAERFCSSYVTALSDMMTNPKS